MSRPIDIPTKGPKAWRRVAKQVADRLEADKPVAGNNTSVRELPGGRQITAQPGGASGSAVLTYFIRNGVLVSYQLLARSGPTIVQ